MSNIATYFLTTEKENPKIFQVIMQKDLRRDFKFNISVQRLKELELE
jgi:hypothetical protein